MLFNVLVVVYIFILVFEFLMWFIIWVLVNMFYWVCVDGMWYLLEEGLVLLVCNYVSFMDLLLLMVYLCWFVCFVMYYWIFNILLLKFVFCIVKVIFIVG